jgi:hypothetical protein
LHDVSSTARWTVKRTTEADDCGSGTEDCD